MNTGTARWMGQLPRLGRGCARAACVLLLTIAIGGGFTTQQLFAFLLSVPSAANAGLVEENKNAAEEELQKHFSGQRCRLRAATLRKTGPFVEPIGRHSRIRLAETQITRHSQPQTLHIPLRC